MSAEKTIRSYLEAFNAADLDALADLYAATTDYRQPFQPGSLTTPADIKAFEGGMFSAFSDVSVELAWLVAEGDTAAAGAIVSATHTAAMPMPDGGTLAATNKRVRLETAEHIRVDAAGKIVEHQRYMDTGAFAQQLGIV
jgi:predicted ester cyclase